MNRIEDILSVAGGEKALSIEVNLDMDDVLKLAAGVAMGVIGALLLFEMLKWLVA